MLRAPPAGDAPWVAMALRYLASFGGIGILDNAFLGAGIPNLCQPLARGGGAE